MADYVEKTQNREKEENKCRRLYMNKPVVVVKNVQKVYGKKGENQSHALKGVSFSIQEGNFWYHGTIWFRKNNVIKCNFNIG